MVLRGSDDSNIQAFQGHHHARNAQLVDNIHFRFLRCKYGTGFELQKVWRGCVQSFLSCSTLTPPSMILYFDDGQKAPNAVP